MSFPAISRALDLRCGFDQPEPGTTEVDYQAMGFDLGYPERRTAGLALAEQERA